MMTDQEIEAIAEKVAKKEYGSAAVESVVAEGTVDSSGDNVIAITITVERGTLDRVSDDAVLDTLTGIRRQLQQKGEDRFPIVGYDTREEQNALGDS